MSKIKMLLDVVSDLRSLAKSIQALTERIVDNELAETIQSDTPAPIINEEKPSPKTVTLEEVRAVLATKSHDGFTAEVRALLEKHGALKLSEIDPAKYGVLLADAEGLK